MMKLVTFIYRSKEGKSKIKNIIIPEDGQEITIN